MDSFVNLLTQPELNLFKFMYYFINSYDLLLFGYERTEGGEACPDFGVLRYLSIDPKNERAPAYRNRIPEAAGCPTEFVDVIRDERGGRARARERQRERERERAPVNGAGGHGSLPPLSLDFSVRRLRVRRHYEGKRGGFI